MKFCKRAKDFNHYYAKDLSTASIINIIYLTYIFTDFLGLLKTYFPIITLT